MLQRRNFTGINPVTKQRNTKYDPSISEVRIEERKVVDMVSTPQKAWLIQVSARQYEQDATTVTRIIGQPCAENVQETRKVKALQKTDSSTNNKAYSFDED